MPRQPLGPAHVAETQTVLQMLVKPEQRRRDVQAAGLS